MTQLTPATADELRLFLTEVRLVLPIHPALEGKPKALKKCLEAVRLYAESRLLDMSQVQLELVLRVLRLESDLRSYLPEPLCQLSFKAQQGQIIHQLQAMQALRLLKKAGAPKEYMPAWA